MANRLLLVDSDPKGLRVLDVGLRSAGFTVETAANGTDAWARLSAAPPDLVIADAALAGIDGFELCARLRQTPTSATIPFIILVADETMEQKLRSLEAGADDYLVKPAYVQEVLARVRERLKRRQRDRLSFAGQDGLSGPVQGDVFRGDLNDITVVDLLQIMEGNARSGIAHVRGEGGVVGSVFFRTGHVVDAEVGRLSGIDALSRLFAWSRGTFDLEWKTIRRKDVIQRPVADLVIEGMQRLDERQRLSGTFAEAHAVFEVDYKVLSERLAEIPDELNEILRLCDGVRSIEQVIEETVMPDVEALIALTRLRDEGIIYNIANSRGLRLARPPEDLSASTWAAANAASFSQPHAGQIPGPPRRRTAPGLGAAKAGNGSIASGDTPAATPVTGGEGIPEAREEPVHAGGFSAVDETRPRVQVVPDTGVGLPRSPPMTEPAGVPARPNMRTQRGFAIPGAELSQGNAIPRVVAESRSGELRESGGEEPAVDLPPEGDGPGADDHARTSLSPTPSEPEAVPPVPVPTAESGAVSGRSALSADATTRISFADDELSRHEALDELGLPSRWRALRFLAVALAAAGLAAFLVIRFRAGTPPSETRLDAAHSDALAGVVGSGEQAVVDAARNSGEAAAPHVESPESAPQEAAAEARSEHSAGGRTAAEPQPPSMVAPTPAATASEPHAIAGSGGSGGAAELMDPRPDGNVVLPPAEARAVEPEVPAATFPRQLAECRAAFARNHLREAFSLCTAAVATNPRSAEALTMLAHTELNRGRLSRAADLATRAIAADPNVADAYVIIGGVRQDSGQNTEARAAYRRYLQLAPHGRYADDLRSILNSL